MRRFIKGSIYAVLLISLMAIPVMAAFSSTITVTESSDTDYDKIGVTLDKDVDYLADHGFISTSGRDVRITQGVTELDYMLVEDRVNFVLGVSGNTTQTAVFTTDNTPQDYKIVPGYKGKITISDDAALELGDNFELECTDTWVDTDATQNADVTSVEQASQNAQHTLYTNNIRRAGQRVTLSMGQVTSVSFYLKKAGAPTGTGYARIYSGEHDGNTLLGTLGSIDVTTLTGVFAWYDFDTTPVALPYWTEDVRIVFEYVGGDAGNNVLVGLNNADTIDGHLTYNTYDVTYTLTWFWTDTTGSDCTIKYTHEAYFPNYLLYKEDAFDIHTSETVDGEIIAEIPQQSVYLLPDGAGDYTNIATQQPGTTFHWDKVDDPVATPDDNTTFVGQNAGTQADAYTLQDSALITGTINEVIVYYRCDSQSGAGLPYTSTYTPGLRLGGVEELGSGTQDISSGWITYWQRFPLDPNGEAWTPAKIHNLQLVIQATKDNATARVTQVYVEVRFTAASVTASGVSSGEHDIVTILGDDAEFDEWASDAIVSVNMGTGLIPAIMLEKQTLTAPAASVTFSDIDELVKGL